MLELALRNIPDVCNKRCWFYGKVLRKLPELDSSGSGGGSAMRPAGRTQKPLTISPDSIESNVGEV